MKNILLPLLIPLVMIGNSCAGDRSITVGTLGPIHFQQSKEETGGVLIVYSEWDRLSNSGESDWLRHTDYFIYSPEGNFLRKVKNFNLGPDDEPVAVELAPGNYTVKVQTQGYGWIRVPILVEKARTTRLYLDNSSRPTVKPEEKDQVIRLPDGRIFGWAGGSTEH